MTFTLLKDFANNRFPSKHGGGGGEGGKIPWRDLKKHVASYPPPQMMTQWDLTHQSLAHFPAGIPSAVALSSLVFFKSCTFREKRVSTVLWMWPAWGCTGFSWNCDETSCGVTADVSCRDGPGWLITSLNNQVQGGSDSQRVSKMGFCEAC